jgi:hypothetical protein
VVFVPGSNRQERWPRRPAAISEQCWLPHGAWFEVFRPCHSDVRSWGTDRGRWMWSCQRTPWCWYLAVPAPTYTAQGPGSTASCEKKFQLY